MVLWALCTALILQVRALSAFSRLHSETDLLGRGTLSSSSSNTMRAVLPSGLTCSSFGTRLGAMRGNGMQVQEEEAPEGGFEGHPAALWGWGCSSHFEHKAAWSQLI